MQIKSFQNNRNSIKKHDVSGVSAVVNNNTSNTSPEIINAAAAVIHDLYVNSRKESDDET